jgi:hypothetical protein
MEMKRNWFKLVGIIALITVIGLDLAGCVMEEDEPSPAVVTFTLRVKNNTHLNNSSDRRVTITKVVLYDGSSTSANILKTYDGLSIAPDGSTSNPFTDAKAVKDFQGDFQAYIETWGYKTGEQASAAQKLSTDAGRTIFPIVSYTAESGLTYIQAGETWVAPVVYISGVYSGYAIDNATKEK